MESIQSEYDILNQYIQLLPLPRELRGIVLEYEGKRAPNIPVYLVEKWFREVALKQYSQTLPFEIHNWKFKSIINVAIMMYEDISRTVKIVGCNKCRQYPIIVVHGTRRHIYGVWVYRRVPTAHEYVPSSRSNLHLENHLGLIPWAFH